MIALHAGLRAKRAATVAMFGASKLPNLQESRMNADKVHGIAIGLLFLAPLAASPMGTARLIADGAVTEGYGRKGRRTSRRMFSNLVRRRSLASPSG